MILKLNKELNYGRDIITHYAIEGLDNHNDMSVLDIAAGHGNDLLNIKRAVKGKASLYAIEGYSQNISELMEQGIQVENINIERDVFPYEDGSFDLVCANQILEHIKELPWVISEVARILRYGGIFIIGVPNLASLHNRILLLAGQQPTSIRTLGPHVRGYTYKDLKDFLETDYYFKVEDVRGSNFYPFPAVIAKGLSRVFPKASVSLLLKVRRTEKPGNFISIFEKRFYETNFYIGEGKTLFDKIIR